ncbi:RDD family protein [Streptomyces sp. NPDC004267]|uniref:RDD family protein n=1 Tax=Streptomyces sp. NPDC004267 TaxID=3364694 RepID=UPI0036C53B72
MSNDQPPPPPSGPPPEDDPFSKRPAGPPGAGQPGGTPPPEPPPGGPPPGTPPPGPPPGGPPPGGGGPPPGGGGPPPGNPYDNAPPPPYGGNGGYGYGGPDPLSGMPPLADSGRRIIARIIDWLIIAVPLAIIGIPFNIYRHATNSDNFDATVNSLNGGSQLAFQLLTIVAYVAYDTVMVATQRGQTLGKKWMKLRVAMLNDGSTPPTNTALVRALVLWLPALICCACLWPLILLILILVDKPYKQGLHDKAAKTVVVSVPS